MTWNIEKGQTISSTEPMLFDFYSNFEYGASKTMVQELIVCDRDNALPYFRKSNGSPTQVLCSMAVNLASVPAHLWKSYRARDGSFYQRLSYQLGMQLESGGLKFDLKGRRCCLWQRHCQVRFGLVRLRPTPASRSAKQREHFMISYFPLSLSMVSKMELSWLACMLTTGERVEWVSRMA
jgi:hypothetical protein